MSFEEKLNVLNPAQREAVESIEGPVMVIAGPGTGKTEILSLRIGNILKNTDTPPGSILCLTYTDAAATEMRHRLIDFIGPEAYRIFVSTFHSFCNLVIQENPSVFQQARELEPISEIDKFKLLQELMDDFSPDHPLKKFKGNSYSDWKRLGDLFATMKKENWTSVYMLQQIEEYVNRMRQHEDFVYKRKSGANQKGDFKEKDFREKVLNKMESLSAAAAEYDQYNNLLTEKGQYDFDDMLLWVNKAFDDHPDLLANYQERFLYFLVDEFQDTNGIQISLLRKLIDHEWLEQPNVFVVGDDDQAIFRFQGANIENLIQFHDRYHPKIIFLKENYRSSQLIINASRVVMQSVDNSLMQLIFKQIKTLTASGPYSDYQQHVVLQSYPTLSYENADIFKQLRQWHEEGSNGEIAVLYSKHELGRELAQALKGAGIPYHSVKTLDALSQPLIMHLLDILQCLHQLSDGADNDDGLLYRVLHLRYLKPNTVDLQRLVMDYTSKERSDTSTFFTWLGNAERLDLLNLRDRGWIDRAFHLIENGIIEYHSRTLLSFVEWVIHEFGMMSWILHQPEKFTFLYSIKTFFNFIEQQASGKKSFRVPDLLEICGLMTTYQIRLPVQELARNNKGIFLSSLHGAKGMQFDKVIIKNITENEWEKKRPYSFSFSYPDNLVRHEIISEIEDSGENEDEDRRRLLYVGMTRAKKELLLTYSVAKDDGKGLIPSLYLTELEQGQLEILKAKATANENILAEYLTSLMSGEQRVDLNKDDVEIHERVKNFVLNVSALNTYLECPLKFYYEKILVIPSGEAPQLLFGTALHDALNRFFRKRFEEKDVTKGKGYLIDLYGWYMERNRHRFTGKELEDLTIYGKRILGQFYDHYYQTWSDQIRYELEYKIQDVHIQGVPVKGFIDRLDRDGDGIMVYDYKSGKADSISNKLKGPEAKDPVGGNYWRQMVFYDLLLREDARVKKGMTMGSILALEPLKDGSFPEKKITVSDDDRAFVKNQIIDTYQKIQNLEFEKGCGKCEWCQMHDLVVPFPKDDSAEED